MEAKHNGLVYYEKIGGLLWLPAIWTITIPLFAGYLMTLSPVHGGLMMAFGIVNAWLFWKRSSLYRGYFVIQAIAFLFLFGAGSSITFIIMLYLLFGRRPRGTFTQPLTRQPEAREALEQ
ncbi:hypothetical protein [Pseudomonas japonica]|uniref:hypothetical protein n=1 Tax=Pseudomonas japonica TaxID=256466 RepID=UPI0015E453C1|nr:hypothetical protein [Pseudomonas japonica]MBA1289569.1 hypothetical protein [Pseudomonas japonica]